MTQPEQAVGGSNDTIIAAEPTIEDRFAAVVDEPQQEEEPEAEQGDDLAPEPEEDGAELEADDIEDDDVQPIPPPASWPDEDKAAFADLPRDLQERVSAREVEREKFIQSKSREAKQVQQQVANEAADAIRKVQDAHVQQIVALLPTVPEEPSAHLLVNDPQRYADELDQRNWALQMHAYAQQQIAAIGSNRDAIDKAQAQQELQSSIDLLREEFPDFLDEAKRPELIKQVKSTGHALGYSEDQLNGVNGNDILALRVASEWKTKADRYDALMAKRMDKVREAKSLPRVSRPGVAQPKGAAANQRYAADRDAMRAGDKDATIKVFSKFF